MGEEGGKRQRRGKRKKEEKKVLEGETAKRTSITTTTTRRREMGGKKVRVARSFLNSLHKNKMQKCPGEHCVNSRHSFAESAPTGLTVVMDGLRECALYSVDIAPTDPEGRALQPGEQVVKNSNPNKLKTEALCGKRNYVWEYACSTAPFTLLFAVMAKAEEAEEEEEDQTARGRSGSTARRTEGETEGEVTTHAFAKRGR